MRASAGKTNGKNRQARLVEALNTLLPESPIQSRLKFSACGSHALSPIFRQNVTNGEFSTCPDKPSKPFQIPSFNKSTSVIGVSQDTSI